MGWFYGFKLHLIINDRGEIITFAITPGNVDDRKPASKMAEMPFGKLFAGLTAYSRRPKKPWLNLFDHKELLPVVL